MKMFKRISTVLVAVLVMAFGGGVAFASGSSESSAYVDASSYGLGATSVDMTITKSTSGSINWTAVIQQGYESGNWYTVAGSTRTGYVSPSSPSYRSWSIPGDLPYGGPHRLKVTYSDGTIDYDYFTLAYR